MGWVCDLISQRHSIGKSIYDYANRYLMEFKFLIIWTIVTY